MQRKVWSASELEGMAPAEQDALFEASIVTNLGEVPGEFVTRVRARVQERIARTETPKAR